MVSCCIAGESLVASGRVPQDTGKVHYVPVVCTLPYDINGRYLSAARITFLRVAILMFAIGPKLILKCSG